MLNLAQSNLGLGLAQNKTFKGRRSKGSNHTREPEEAVNLSTPRVRIYKRGES